MKNCGESYWILYVFHNVKDKLFRHFERGGGGGGGGEGGGAIAMFPKFRRASKLIWLIFQGDHFQRGGGRVILPPLPPSIYYSVIILPCPSLHYPPCRDESVCVFTASPSSPEPNWRGIPSSARRPQTSC